MNVLSSIDEMLLKKAIVKAARSINNKNWEDFSAIAVEIIESSGYIGAGRIYYVCYAIHEAWIKKDFPLMLDNYPSFVETIIEFKIAA